MSQTVSIRLNEHIISNLEKLSKITDRSKAWLMGHAIEQYVEHESWQIEAIEKSLSKVQNGKATFAQHQDVTDWLATWRTENEGTVPK